MNYSQLFRRAANIVWQHKFLIVLGILAAFSSGSGGGNNGFRFDLDGGQPGQQWQWPEGVPQDMPFLPELQGMGAGVPAVVILLACVALLVGAALYVLGTIARGGLIASVDDIEEGRKTSFGEAWGAGWRRGWTLVGIGLLPAIPALIGFLIALMGLAATAGLSSIGRGFAVSNVGVGSFFGILLCILLPVSLVLSLLRTFANRAAMLEGLGVLASYGRGFSVLMENLGPALLIFILQVVITVVLAIVLLPAGVFVALCCLLWPLLFLFQGFMASFFSAVWTLAWRQWTGQTLKFSVRD